MNTPLVWLPFDSDLLGDPPENLRYEVVDGTDDLPDSVGDVEFYVPPYQVGSVGHVLRRMSGLRVLQTMTAGVDNFRPDVPPGSWRTKKPSRLKPASPSPTKVSG